MTEKDAPLEEVQLFNLENGADGRNASPSFHTSPQSLPPITPHLSPLSDQVQFSNLDEGDDELNTTLSGLKISSYLSTSDPDLYVCRICQQYQSDTGEKPQSTHCHCRGSIGIIHRSCLTKWICLKRSNVCELCNHRFRHSRLLYTEVTETEGQTSRCSDSRRRWFAAIFLTLLITTAVAAALTFVTMEDYEKAWQHSYEQREQGGSLTASISKLDTYRFYYGLALAVLVFCACFTILILFLWAIVEMHCSDLFDLTLRQARHIPLENLRVLYDDEELSDSENYHDYEEYVV